MNKIQEENGIQKEVRKSNIFFNDMCMCWHEVNEAQEELLKAVIEEIEKKRVTVKSIDLQTSTAYIRRHGYNEALIEIKQLLEDSIK